MRSIVKWVLIRPIIALVVIFILWQVWVFMHARPRVYSVAEIGAVNQATEQVRDLLAQQLQGPVRFGVAHFVNDDSDRVTESIRHALASRDGWTVEQGSILKKFLEDITKAAANATTVEEIIKAGQRVEIDVFVMGQILSIDETNGVGRATVQVYAYDVRPGAWVLQKAVTSEWKPNLVNQTMGKVSSLRPRSKFVLWILFVLLLPWVTYPLTHWALEKKTNVASFVVISLYTVLDLTLAVLLTGFRIVGGESWLMFLSAFVLSAGYSFWTCERIARRAAS